MMQVQVNMKVKAQEAMNSNFSLKVNAEELVEKVKERIATSQLVAFPDQDLVFQGTKLEEGKKLSDYGVKESDSLDFVIRASEETLVSQVKELLQTRDLTCDELGLLYCYKHGVSLNQALKTVGCQEKFQEYIKRQTKSFVVENGKVSLVREDTSLKPFSVAQECKKILEEADGAMEVTALASKFIQKFNVSMSSMVKMRPAEYLAQEKDLFEISKSGTVSLKGAAKKKAAAPPLAPEKKTAALKPNNDLGLRADAKAFVPAPRQAEAAAEASESITATSTSDDQTYQELHTKISGRSFNSKIVQTLNNLENLVKEKSFLNVEKVERGGSVAKGTAITGASDAEIVFFLRGMPTTRQDKWLPPLLKAVAATLTQHFSEAGKEAGKVDVAVNKSSVSLTMDLLTVHLRFSACFKSYDETVQALGEQGPESREFFGAAFVKEKTQFIAKQTGQVKVTTRLLRWWRDQQSWSSALSRPSDEVMELVAVYSALQTKPRDQAQAIANAMSLMSRFSELRIVWSNYYKREDIWAPLMSHRPLLMDPVNPFVNVADHQSFDSRELMALSKTTHFFW